MRKTSSGPSGNSYNELWSSPERVTMSDSETVLAELALAARVHLHKVQGCKRELKNAYWQVPRSQKGIRVFMLFWHSETKAVRARELLTKDFGAAGGPSGVAIGFLEPRLSSSSISSFCRSTII